MTGAVAMVPVSVQQLNEVKQLLEKHYPGKEILFQNSLERGDIQQWLATLNHMQSPAYRKSLALDYEVYGAGEKELAWFDAEVEIKTADHSAVEAGAFFINLVFRKINERQFPIGYLKFLLDDGQRQSKISFTSSSPTDFSYTPEKWMATQVKVLVNARVQTTPA
jgi:hypothetical protein